MAGVERRPVLDRHQHVLETMSLSRVVVDVSRRDDAQLQVLCQFHQHPVAPDVPVDEVVLELDEEIAVAEPVRVSPRGRFRLTVLPRGDQRRHLAKAAAGEHDEPLRVPREDVQFDARLPSLVLQVGVGQQAAEVGVAPLRLAEQRQVNRGGGVIFLLPSSIFPGAGLGWGKRDLRAGDRAQAPGPRAVRELHRPVQTIVVSERERLIAELQRPQHQLLDVGGAFEEGEVGVGVQFGVRHRLHATTNSIYFC